MPPTLALQAPLRRPTRTWAGPAVAYPVPTERKRVPTERKLVFFDLLHQHL